MVTEIRKKKRKGQNPYLISSPFSIFSKYKCQIFFFFSLVCGIYFLVWFGFTFFKGGLSAMNLHLKFNLELTSALARKFICGYQYRL